jgi:hypothetical protein
MPAKRGGDLECLSATVTVQAGNEFPPAAESGAAPRLWMPRSDSADSLGILAGQATLCLLRMTAVPDKRSYGVRPMPTNNETT